MKRFIIGFLFLFLLTTSVSAVVQDEYDFVIKQYESYEVKIPCSVEGSPCTSQTRCNLTMNYPNSSPLINNQAMTLAGQEMIYTLSPSQTSVLGLHKVVGGCQDVTSGLNDTQSGWANVTPTGDLRGNGFQLILLIISFVLIVFGIYITNPYIATSGGFLMMLVGVYTVLYGFQDLSNLYTRSIGYSAIGLGLFFSIMSAYELAITGEASTGEGSNNDE